VGPSPSTINLALHLACLLGKVGLFQPVVNHIIASHNTVTACPINEKENRKHLTCGITNWIVTGISLPGEKFVTFDRSFRVDTKHELHSP
jgi:hypothetical protein